MVPLNIFSCVKFTHRSKDIDKLQEANKKQSEGHGCVPSFVNLALILIQQNMHFRRKKSVSAPPHTYIAPSKSATPSPFGFARSQTGKSVGVTVGSSLLMVVSIDNDSYVISTD